MNLVCFLMFQFALLCGLNPDFTFSYEPVYKLFAKSDYRNFVICIYKNIHYHGNDLEILYKARCLDVKKNTAREFYIQKTDPELKEKTLANFALTEHGRKGEKLIYPFGWETEKIGTKDITDNCVSIIESKIPPV